MGLTTKQMKEAVVTGVAAQKEEPAIAPEPGTVSTGKRTVKPTVKSFRDLGTWQLAQELAVAVYRQCELFPQVVSVLTCQMGQAATIAAANIAESFSLRGLDKERAFGCAQNAINRLESHLLIAEGLGYLNKPQADDLCRRCSNTRWALIKLQKINREWMSR